MSAVRSEYVSTMKDIKIDDIKDFIVKVFVVGYHSQGESIIVLFYDKSNDSVFYSIVIDCFQKRKVNKTVDLLNECNIKTINVLCWSHPDNDHSWGLDKIIGHFCGKGTKFLYPYGIETSNLLFDTYIERYQRKYIDLIESKVKDKRLESLPQSISMKNFNCVDSFSLSTGLENIDIELLSLSPFGEQLRHKYLKDKYTLCKNDFSIVLSLHVGEYVFLFTSDIENENIRNLRDKEFRNPVFIKIPHHGAASSNEMVDLLKHNRSNNNTVPLCDGGKGTTSGLCAATTIFTPQKDPKDEVIELYKPITSSIFSTHTDPKREFGIIEYSFNLFGGGEVDIMPHGNSIRLHAM